MTDLRREEDENLRNPKNVVFFHFPGFSNWNEWEKVKKFCGEIKNELSLQNFFKKGKERSRATLDYYMPIKKFINETFLSFSPLYYDNYVRKKE